MVLSFVIPTHNRAHLVSFAINSILKQRIDNYEIIVVNDGSRDNTDKVLASFEDKIQVIRNEKAAGVSASRNLGVDRARGKWIAFLDDDDYYIEDTLPEVFSVLADGSIDFFWVGCEDVHTDTDNRTLRWCEEISPKELSTATFVHRIGAGFLFVKRTAFLAVRGFDSELSLSEDRDLVLRLLKNGAKYTSHPKPVLCRRMHSDSKSRTSSREEQLLADLAVLKKNRHFLNTKPHLEVRLLDDIASNYLLMGRKPAALAFAKKSLQRMPVRIKGVRRLVEILLSRD